MELITPKLGRSSGGYWHYCPGCKNDHYIATDKPLANGACWKFSGTIGEPTFTPSVRIYIQKTDDYPATTCHYNITKGEIQFHADSTHELAGQKVPLPDIPAKHFE